MGNPLCHWELMVSDVEKAKAFYTRVFDWEIAHSGMGGYWMIQTGREPGGGMMARPPEAPACALSQYFLVDDIDVTLEKVTAAGGTVVLSKMEISKEIGSFAVFTDPDGIAVGIFQPAEHG